MSEKGHEDQFLPPKLNARSVIRKETVAATRGNGRDAPIPAVCGIESFRQDTTIQSQFWPGQRIAGAARKRPFASAYKSMTETTRKWLFLRHPGSA
jgi:hypothetical protein